MKRDLVVMGGSAGSIGVLKNIVGALPSDLHAAVVVVVHLPARGRNVLMHILAGASKLPVIEASDSAPIESGFTYIAPPDRHLLIANGHMHLTRGPKEGLHRPSINVTFRSAAQARGPRIVGVLLSGMLDDGAAGMWEISRQGGVAIIQDPDEAEFPSMPLNALQDAPIHYQERSERIAPLVVRLVDGEDPVGLLINPAGRPAEQFSGFTCPECRGPLYRARLSEQIVEFRCRVGHVFSPELLLNEHTSVQERKLYEAILALDEGAGLAEYMAGRVEENQRERLMNEAAQLRRHATAIRAMIEELKISSIEPSPQSAMGIEPATS